MGSKTERLCAKCGRELPKEWLPARCTRCTEHASLKPFDSINKAHLTAGLHLKYSPQKVKQFMRILTEREETSQCIFCGSKRILPDRTTCAADTGYYGAQLESWIRSKAMPEKMAAEARQHRREVEIPYEKAEAAKAKQKAEEDAKKADLITVEKQKKKEEREAKRAEARKSTEERQRLRNERREQREAERLAKVRYHPMPDSVRQAIRKRLKDDSKMKNLVRLGAAKKVESAPALWQKVREKENRLPVKKDVA